MLPKVTSKIAQPINFCEAKISLCASKISLAEWRISQLRQQIYHCKAVALHIRARSSVGRVLHSHCRCREFESHRVHQQKSPFCLPDKRDFLSGAFLSERDVHFVRDADFVRDARLRRVSGTHRITYHSKATSLITICIAVYHNRVSDA